MPQTGWTPPGTGRPNSGSALAGSIEMAHQSSAWSGARRVSRISNTSATETEWSFPRGPVPSTWNRRCVHQSPIASISLYLIKNPPVPRERRPATPKSAPLAHAARGRTSRDSSSPEAPDGTGAVFAQNARLHEHWGGTQTDPIEAWPSLPRADDRPGRQPWNRVTDNHKTDGQP